jgi:Domain of unknown function (DUF4367)
MRISGNERLRAERVSAAVDQLIRDPDAQPDSLDPADAGLVPAIRQLARLPALLGPVDPLLEQRVMAQVRVDGTPARRAPRFRPAWAVVGVAIVLLAAMLLTPAGQTAVASFMAVFNLGRTEVRITPVDTTSTPLATAAAQSTAVRQSLTLAEAQAQVHFAIPQPAYLPPGYRLREVVSFSYPDLPAWVPQPFFVELTYGDEEGHGLALRVYPITLGDQANISGLNLEASPIQDVQDVEVNGQPGVLLKLGADRAEAPWQELVWEQGDLILALSGADMAEAELLRIARSVHE